MARIGRDRIVLHEPLPPPRLAEQTMGMPATKRWTTEEVRALMDENRPTPRYELIDGELLVSFDSAEPDVTNAPTIEHQRAVRELLRVLDAHLSADMGEALSAPADLELEPGSIVQPDVFVMAAGAAGLPRSWAEVSGLLLAIEVLSPSTARYDRVVKRHFYQRVGVAEYWVVDVSSRVIERWHAEDERPEVVDGSITWHPAGVAEPLVLDLETFFARVHAED